MLISSLEELLTIPISDIKGELQLIPCPNCSRLTWLTSDDLEHNYCSICSGKGDMPNEQFGDLIREMKEECQTLDKCLPDYKYEIIPRSPTRTEKLPLIRPSDSTLSLRERISELPGRIFKRSDSGSSRRSITSIDSSDQRSLLRTSSELGDVRGTRTGLLR